MIYFNTKTRKLISKFLLKPSWLDNRYRIVSNLKVHLREVSVNKTV